MKNQQSGYPRFSVTRNFFIYLGIVAFSLVFTQALRSPASHMMFKFVLILPLISLLYALIGLAAIKVYVVSEETTTQKYAPLAYEFRIINASPLPFPFLDTVISLPKKDGIRCEEKLYGISLLPGGVYPLGNETRFRYRGVYEVGVSCIFIYDFFKLFRIRLDVDIFSSIFVMPRRLSVTRAALTSATDIPTDMTRVVRGSDQSEIGDIRQYMNGDSLKNIHWKLSSKTQDLQVKDYTTNTGRHVYLLCDFAAQELTVPEVATYREEKRTSVRHLLRRKPLRVKSLTGEHLSVDKPEPSSPEAVPTAENAFDFTLANTVLPEYLEDMNEFCADGVTEIAAAIAETELRAGNTCTLLYFDERAEGGVAVHTMSAVGDFEAIFKSFATTPLCPHENSVMRLSSLIGESLNVTLRIVTASADGASISGYAAVPSLFGGAGTGCLTEVLLFHPEQRYADLPSRRDYIELCRARLMQNGVLLTEVKSEQITEDGHLYFS